VSCTFFLILSFGAQGAASLSALGALKRALISEGISKQTAQNYLRASVGAVNLKVILKNLSHKEKERDYISFLQEKRIAEARQFLGRHCSLLSDIEKAYGVPKEVIVAILMVESSLGEDHGRYLVFGVYTSLASMLDRKVRESVRREAAKAGIDINSPAFKKRITSKATWGLQELACLLRLSEKGKVNPFRLKGSWAGAFGMPQFIPSSFEKYGIDWDGDGKVKLDRLPDAAASAANYLRAHGWKKAMDPTKALGVIKRYNHSQPYADAILELSKHLKR